MELPLKCAQIFDPDNIGLECWSVGAPPNELCLRRLHCYELVLDSLSVFEEKSTKASALPLDDLETVRSRAYELALQSEDEMFHSTMYDWLIERQLADDLLEVRGF